MLNDPVSFIITCWSVKDKSVRSLVCISGISHFRPLLPNHLANFDLTLQHYWINVIAKTFTALNQYNRFERFFKKIIEPKEPKE